MLHVAENDEADRVVGYALHDGVPAAARGRPAPPTCRSSSSTRRPAAPGIGTALVEANELYAVERGVRQLTMSTSRAGDFYRRLGYDVTAEFYKKILPLG